MQIPISSSISPQIKDRETNKQSDLSSLQIIILLNLLWFGQAGMYPAAALVWSAQSREERASALSECPCVLIPLQILWISYFHWHYMAVSFPGYPDMKSRALSLEKCWGQEGRCDMDHPSCLFEWLELYFPYLHLGDFPSWFTCTSKSPLSMSKGHLPKASMRWRVLAFQCYTASFKHHLMSKSHRTAHPQPLTACWPLGLPLLMATELLIPWEKQCGHSTLEVTRKTGQIQASRASRKFS